MKEVAYMNQQWKKRLALGVTNWLLMVNVGMAETYTNTVTGGFISDGSIIQVNGVDGIRPVTGEVTGGHDIEIKMKNGTMTTSGITSSNHNVTLGDRLKITSLEGELASTISVKSGKTITIGNDSILTAKNINGGQFNNFFTAATVQAWGQGRVEIGDGAQIVAEGKIATGLYVNEGSRIRVGENLNLNASGRTVMGVWALGTNSKIVLKGGTIVVSGTDYARAFQVEEGGFITGDGVYQINGDILAHSGGGVTLSLDEGSNWQGNSLAMSVTNGVNTYAGKINITLLSSPQM